MTRPSETEMTAAAERGWNASVTEPRAQTARYDAADGRVAIELTNGCTFAFPPARLQGLGSATVEELAAVEVLPGGESIYWESLDVGFSVPNLVAGSFGSEAWMRELARASEVF
jgi:hypothetical protein